MHSWQRKSLGEFIELKRGYDLPSRDRAPGAFPLVTSSGPTEYISQSKVKGPGVVTGRYGTVGQVFYVQKDFWPLNTALYVRDFRGNDPRFVYYFLQGIDWEKFNDKSGVPGINRNDVHREPVFVPPLDQQKQISTVLATLDDKIELNRRMNETLEGMAQAIFRDWFVDFGPVRRKMAGATDPVAIMGGLTPDLTRATELAALFPDALDVDDLPAGWRLTKLCDVFDVKIGRTPPRKESEHFALKGTGEHWMSIRDMGACGAFITSTAEDLTKRAVERFRVPPIPDKTVVVSFKLTVGRVAITTGTMFSNEAIAQLRAKEGSPSAWFTYCWMKTFDYSQLGSTSSIATAVNSDSIKGIPFPVVVDAVLEAFDRIAEPIFERIRTSTLESDTLAETRDYLLPRLMSGEVRVGDAALEIAA